MSKKSAKPSTPAPVSETAVAAVFFAMGAPARVRILNTLATGEKTIGQISEATALGQSNTTKHVQILAASGVVTTRKTGLSTCVTVADWYPLLSQQVLGMLRNAVEAKLKALG